jgi:hypothetical protein
MLDDELSRRFKDAALEAPGNLDMVRVHKRARSLLWIRRGMAMTMVIIVVAVGGTIATRWPSNGSIVHSATAQTQTPPDWLISLEQNEAKWNNDPSPSTALWALTNQMAAAPAVGDATGDRTKSEYLVEMTGHFQNNHGFIAPDQLAPSGTTLVFTADPESHHVVDLGIVSGEVDTSEVGPMYPFPTSAQG